tara:strand:+ start:188 stop:1453 length:1266 start_codon:yes stop_codon:yes gene_type:complete
MNLVQRIEHTPIEDLVPYAANARTHSEDQVSQIAASIKEFGFNNPVLIDVDNGIIAGHGRVMAAMKLGLDLVPTVTLDHLSDAERRAYILADNRLALSAGWDEEILASELKRLDDEIDLSLLGFDDDELARLLDLQSDEGLTDEDDVPELPETPQTVEGDVWLLGRHRLMCGDSTIVDSVEKLMSGSKADMVFTDPPYGMSYGGGRAKGDSVKFKNRSGGIKAHGMILGDDFAGDDLIEMIRDAVGSAVLVSKSGASKYICFPWRTYTEFKGALNQIGLIASACIVWDKKSIGLGHSNYRPQHEFIFYIKGENWHGDKAQSDVWYMSRGSTGEYVHPTQKPVELIEKAISNSSKSQDIVIDVFGGSGSTLIACEKTARDCRMMELDPKYCDVIIKRWQDYTGEQATHEATGKTFDDVIDVS